MRRTRPDPKTMFGLEDKHKFPKLKHIGTKTSHNGFRGGMLGSNRNGNSLCVYIYTFVYFLALSAKKAYKTIACW